MNCELYNNFCENVWSTPSSWSLQCLLCWKQLKLSDGFQEVHKYDSQTKKFCLWSWCHSATYIFVKTENCLVPFYIYLTSWPFLYPCLSPSQKPLVSLAWRLLLVSFSSAVRIKKTEIRWIMIFSLYVGPDGICRLNLHFLCWFRGKCGILQNEFAHGKKCSWKHYTLIGNTINLAKIFNKQACISQITCKLKMKSV